MEFDINLLSPNSNAHADVIYGSHKLPNSQMLCFSSPFHNAASDALITRTPQGYGFGGMTSGFRGPFTPSQWMELEHQALIYKYFTANVPLPSYLLNPIKKALDSSGFSCFSLLRPNALEWGAFQLGFSNTDPEPGRCRRTDGKKWRCSRDAVPDQKYCERHINRGRHRSRKPVEGATTTTTAVPDDGARPGKTGIKKCVVEKKNATAPYSTFHSTASPDQQSGFKESSRSEFGLVCSDSLLNPLHRSLSLLNSTNYDNLNDSEPNSENVIRQFLEVYPKSHSLSWSDVDRTQLSISIPNASPTNEKLPVSPLRLSQENEATRMGLNVGGEQNLRQNNWVPISWEPSIGGPLGEALECKNPEALNLIENWDHSTRAESIKVVDGAGFYNGLIGQGLMLPSLPAL